MDNFLRLAVWATTSKVQQFKENSYPGNKKTSLLGFYLET